MNDKAKLELPDPPTNEEYLEAAGWTPAAPLFPGEWWTPRGQVRLSVAAALKRQKLEDKKRLAYLLVSLTDDKGYERVIGMMLGLVALNALHGMTQEMVASPAGLAELGARVGSALTDKDGEKAMQTALRALGAAIRAAEAFAPVGEKPKQGKVGPS